MGLIEAWSDIRAQIRAQDAAQERENAKLLLAAHEAAQDSKGWEQPRLEQPAPVLPVVNSVGGAYIDLTLIYSGQDIRHIEMSNADALALLLALAKGLFGGSR